MWVCLTSVFTANLPTNIMDCRGFDSSITLILRGGGEFPESSSQAILVGRLGVPLAARRSDEAVLSELCMGGARPGELLH